MLLQSVNLISMNASADSQWCWPSFSLSGSLFCMTGLNTARACLTPRTLDWTASDVLVLLRRRKIMDIRNVLVPVDFSPASQFAVDFAVSFARKFRARLTLLHVVESATALTYTFPIENDNLGNKHSDEALGQLTAMLSPEDQDDLDLQIQIRSGNIETEIRSTVEDEAASIVVMGTRHHRLVRRLIVGSVTENMIRRLPVPVLTVSSDAQPKNLSRILSATDLTESLHDGFKLALDLARKFGAHLMVLHVIEPVPMSLGGGIPVIDSRAEKKLLFENARRKLAELESEGARQNVVVVSEVMEGDASEGILAEVKKSASQLIVLTIHNKGLVERALLGSTAERVVRDSHVPVLSFPVHFKTDRVENTESDRASLPDPSAMP
jgi:nucleotide-binding universal stress UspA family protein